MIVCGRLLRGRVLRFYGGILGCANLHLKVDSMTIFEVSHEEQNITEDIGTEGTGLVFTICGQ